MEKINQFVQLHFKMMLAGILIIAVSASFAVSYMLAKQDQVAADQPCQVNICVDLTENGMQPSEIAVKTGEFVQFNTKDGRFHSLSLGKGASHGSGEAHGDAHDESSSTQSHQDEEHSHEHLGTLQSGKFGPGEGWQVQFTQPGTFVIHDHNYPEHSILVVVYDEK